MTTVTVPKISVSNMVSSRGNDVPNQFEIHTDAGDYFQSYTTMIAFVDNEGNVSLSEKWSYSQTTLKYLKQFLNTNETKKQIQKRIDDGQYNIVEFN